MEIFKILSVVEKVKRERSSAVSHNAMPKVLVHRSIKRQKKKYSFFHTVQDQSKISHKTF